MDPGSANTVISKMPMSNPNGHDVFPSGDDGVNVISLPGPGLSYVDTAGMYCTLCGCRPRLAIRDGAVHAEDPCPCPDGITTVAGLRVPSGRLVISDDLRPVYDWARPRSFPGISSAAGIAQATREMEEQGCAYGFVGNSCPGLHATPENGPDTYMVASCDDDLHPWDSALARICTDHWAYMAADFDDWTARGGSPAGIDARRTTIVDITPGTYRFTCHSAERAFDCDAPGTVVFARVKRMS